MDIYENVNFIRLMEPVLSVVYESRHAGLANLVVQTSEGIQNVIFNLMNTSVVWLLQHSELHDPSLHKSQELTFM